MAIFYKRLPDADGYHVYQFRPLTYWFFTPLIIMLALWVSFFQINMIALVLLIALAVTLFIDLLPIKIQNYKVGVSSKKSRKEGSAFSMKNPLTLYYEK